MTQSKTGTSLTIEVLPALAAIIAATPSGQLTFLVNEYGQPFASAAAFGNWFRVQCRRAGLPLECAAHGLRKAACRRLAEAGMSANVIASISCHKSLKEVRALHPCSRPATPEWRPSAARIANGSLSNLTICQLSNLLSDWQHTCLFPYVSSD